MTGTFSFRAVRLLLTLAAATLLTLTLPLTARAGDGTFVEGRYNFTVSVRFNATEIQLRQIETAFRNASAVLYDATDGQQQFGTITIVNNDGPRFTEGGCFAAPSEASNSAEFWVEPQGGRAHATYGDYGHPGFHVVLYFPSNFQQLGGAEGDAYTIAHELGHHSYGLADEYADRTLQRAAECAADPDTAALSFCLMDDYFTRGGRCFGCPGVYTLNEFCVAGNHDPDRDTAQEDINHESCWATIGRHPLRGASVPQGLPVEAPPPAAPVTFQRVGGNLRVMLVIDRSASMADLDRMTYAKGAAKMLVNLLRVGDTVGLVSYGSSATLDAPLTRISSPEVNEPARISIRNAIDALTPGGGTFIAAGLRAAVGNFAAQPQRSANEVVILVSDGNNNTGDAPSSAIPALLQPPSVPVMALLVGGATASGQTTLQNIAAKTGGKFFLVERPENLERLMLFTQAESSHAGLVAREERTLAPGEVTEFPAFIEAGARGATFGVSVKDGARDVTLSLRTPSGRIITTADALPGSNVRYAEEFFGKSFQVCAPEAGAWSIIVANRGASNAAVQGYAFSEQDGVELAVSAPRSLPAFPEAAELHAAPTYRGERVVGATVTGAAVRPDGSSVALTFYDDGLPEHADSLAGDGIYGARFSRYNANGTYTFDVKVTNAGGNTYAGEKLFSFAPSNAKPVPRFTRISSTTVVVSGVPAGITEADLAVTATASPNPVLTGSNVVYTFNVTNKGPQTASAVKLTVNLAPQVALASCAATGGGVCGGTPARPTVTFSSLAPGASQTVRLTAAVKCAVADAAQLITTATVSSQATDFEPGNNSASVSVRASNPPPVISGASADPAVLWSPNHKMVDVKVSYKVTDNCGPVVTRLSVASNEPVNGTGDGDTSPDWEVVSDRLVRLRAERAGNGAGRTYTITITATDSASQSSSRQVTVTVPKSQKK